MATSTNRELTILHDFYLAGPIEDGSYNADHCYTRLLKFFLEVNRLDWILLDTYREQHGMAKDEEDIISRKPYLHQHQAECVNIALLLEILYHCQSWPQGYIRLHQSWAACIREEGTSMLDGIDDHQAKSYSNITRHAKM